MESERCWSHAMELKLYANSEPRKKFHMVRKLSKAAKYAEELNSLCNLENIDARTKLEVQVSSINNQKKKRKFFIITYLMLIMMSIKKYFW